ncbi:hypothetical protein PIROE2DRAFT_13516 [Piromyces sp. E2]|nr:hypothetical protein PIROE2DRAFT_13516 [Piromyces sp. E2]|eukprot:OUM60658.1 hypothetical protein PIROE2DRAFT_13516 [Piromyces sp. E2]
MSYKSDPYLSENIGKLNRKLLPEISLNDNIKEIYEAPKTNIEKTLYDFFDLGRTSVIAIRMVTKIHKFINMKMKDIIERSNIFEISKYIEKILKENKYEKIAIQNMNKRYFPITSQQLDIYMNQLKNALWNYLMKTKFLKFISVNENNINKIYGVYDENAKLIFEYYDINNVNNFIKPFDISSTPLIRIGFIKDKYLLIYIILLVMVVQ